MEIQTEIMHEGQQYLDTPVYVQPKYENMLSICIQSAYGNFQVKPPLLVGYERAKLKWMKPDGSGGLKPV